MSHNQEELLAPTDGTTVKASEIEEIVASWLCRKNGKHVVNFKIAKEAQRRHTRKRSRQAVEPTTTVICSADNSKRLLNSKVFLAFYKSFKDSICSFEDYVIEIATGTKETKDSNKTKTKTTNDNNDNDDYDSIPPTKRQRLSKNNKNSIKCNSNDNSNNDDCDEDNVDDEEPDFDAPVFV